MNDQIKGVADRLAGLGYTSLVPDLYKGKVTVEAEEASHMMQNLDFADASTDVRGGGGAPEAELSQGGGHRFLHGRGPDRAGGGVRQGRGRGVLLVRGFRRRKRPTRRTISIPFQGHFALEDGFFTPDKVDALEARLKEGNVTHEFYRYQAQHAFGNETGAAYNADAANLAWERSTEFLARHLK